MSNIKTLPTHLFVGSEAKLHQTVTSHLQQTFCTKQPTSPECFCPECRKIKNNQHAFVIWLEPVKHYLVSDLAIISEKIRFSLEHNKRFFFIIQKAHLLTPVCANKLLKTLEEPPNGYTFFLLTNNEQAILPTIRSRCSIHHTKTTINQLLVHPILSFFIDPQKMSDAFYFEQELRKQKISEPETVVLINDLTHSIQQRLITYKKKCFTYADLQRLEQDKNYKHLVTTLEFLQQQLKKLPQPGSASLFWKKLFLTFPRKQISRKQSFR